MKQSCILSPLTYIANILQNYYKNGKTGNYDRWNQICKTSKDDLETFIMRVKMEGQESWLILNVKKI